MNLPLRSMEPRHRLYECASRLFTTASPGWALLGCYLLRSYVKSPAYPDPIDSMGMCVMGSCANNGSEGCKWTRRARLAVCPCRPHSRGKQRLAHQQAADRLL